MLAGFQHRNEPTSQPTSTGFCGLGCEPTCFASKSRAVASECRVHVVVVIVVVAAVVEQLPPKVLQLEAIQMTKAEESCLKNHLEGGPNSNANPNDEQTSPFCSVLKLWGKLKISNKWSLSISLVVTKHASTKRRFGKIEPKVAYHLYIYIYTYLCLQLLIYTFFT